MSRRLSIRDVVNEARAAGVLPPDIETPLRASLRASAADDVPWYLQLLLGGAAAIAAIFLIGSVLGIVAMMLGDRTEVAALMLSLVLLPAGVLLRMRTRGAFARQAALVVLVAGQLLLVGAIAELTNETLPAAVAAIVSSAVLIAWHDDGVYRFGATIALLVALLVVGFEARVPHAIGLLTAVATLVMLVVWRSEGARPHLRRLDPVAWACATAVSGMLAWQVAMGSVGVGSMGGGQVDTALGPLLPASWPLTALFVGVLIWIVWRVCEEHGATPAAPLPLAAIAAAVGIGVLTRATPGITGAMVLIVVGFDRRRPALVGLASLGLIGFLGVYYYDLSLTLLQKSLLLVASGSACLGVAWLARTATEPSA